MAENDPVPRSRNYVHSHCGGETVVSGGDFESLANPFRYTSGTMCVTCNRVVSLDQVAWSDTGETIAAYRRRHRSEAPASHKLVVWLIGPALLGLIGAGVGYAIKPGDVAAIATGVFTGAFLYLAFLVPIVTRLLMGVDYRTFA